MQQAPPVLTTEEVASLLRTSRQSIHRWIAQGKLTPLDVPGRSLKFNREDIERLIAPQVANTA